MKGLIEKLLQNKKKILIIAISLLAIITIIVSFSLLKDRAVKSPLKVEKEVIDDTGLNPVPEEKPVTTSYSNLLAFTKEGMLTLYDYRGNKLDSVELREYDLLNEQFINKNNEEMIESRIDSISSKVKDSAGKDSEKLDKIESDLNEVADKLKKAVEDVETKTTTPVNIGETTTFTLFKTMDGDIVFRDDNRGALILATDQNGKIAIEVLLRGWNFSPLTAINFDEENLYLTFDGKEEITEVNRNSMVGKKATEKDMVVYEIGLIPDNAFGIGDTLYFSSKDDFNSFNKTTGELTEMDLGAATTEVFFFNDKIYLVNEFGSGLDNNILVKVNPSDLKVEDIVELKGLYSKLVGLSGEKAYFRQPGNLKEVNLNDMKSLKSYDRESGVPILVNNDAFFVLKDNVMSINSIETLENIDSFDATGFNFVFIK